MEVLTAQLKEQAAQVQKASASQGVGVVGSEAATAIPESRHAISTVANGFRH